MNPIQARALDPHTLLFSLGMLGFLMAVVFLSFARALPEYRAALVAWSKAMAAAGAAFTLYFFRGQAPLLFTFVLANALVFGLPHWAHEAHARLLKVAPRRSWTLGLSAFGMSGVLASYYLGSPHPVAFFTISLAFSALLAMTGWLLLRGQQQRRSRAMLVAMFVHALLSLGFALRATFGLMSGVEHFLPPAPSLTLLFTLVPGVVLIVVCSICILSMVHEQHMDRAEARQHDLERSARQIEQASAMKSQFLANMSHEIRTPLNAILGSAQMLQRRTADEKQQQRLVAAIHTAGHTLLELVNDVLDLSRIESGRVQLELRPFLLREVLAGVVEVLTPTAQAKGLQLTLLPLPDGLPTLAGDAQRLEQVLYNLVGNAIKFTHTGGVTIEVSVLGHEQERVRLQLSVRDSGIGIAADKVEQIFNPFTQADSSTTRRYGGTGLGLAICQQLVTLMGGQIGVNSQPGAGSEFWVRLALDVSAAPAQHARVRVQAGSRGGPRLEGLRVLVVDDVAANVDVARLHLEAEGATCVTAHHGQEALDRLQQAPGSVDVVLMDLQMPEIDGFEVARRMRADAALAGMPVIALTAGVLPHQRERALAAGMNDFIGKPFEADALVATILQWTPPRDSAVKLVPVDAPAMWPAEDPFPVVAGIDCRKAQHRFMGDSALFLRLLQGLRDEFADVVEVVRFEVDQGKLAAAAMRMHKLCGLAGIVLADALAAAAAELEAALRSKQLVALDAQLQAVDDALRLLIEATPAQTSAVAEVAAAKGQGAAPAQVSPQQMAALLDAVQEGDTSALDHFEALRNELTRRHGVESVAQLDQALYGFRFEQAGSVLQAWGHRVDERTALAQTG